MEPSRVTTVTADADTFTCNAYLVEGETTALVDAGAWVGVVDAIQNRVDEVNSLVITHQDADHVAMVDQVCEAFDPSVYAYDAHSRRTDELHDGDEIQLGDEPFDVVYTPGHGTDHVAFVSETTLFSGDVVVHDDGAYDYGSFGKTNRPGDDREELIRSLGRLLDRMPDGVTHMYAGHGGVFHGDVRDVVVTAKERAEERQPKYPDG